MGNVYVLYIGSICIHGKELLRQFNIPSKIQEKISQWNRCLTYLTSWYWNNQMRFLECLRSAGKNLHGNNCLWSMMKKSSVSRMQRFMYSQILCCVLERWIRTHHQTLLGNSSCIGSKMHHNTELWTQLTDSRWNSSGIFSQDSPRCSSSKKSKSSWTKCANQNNSKDKLTSCRFQWHHIGN